MALHPEDLERSFTLDKSVADQVLKEHKVHIVRDLNLSSLMPYLIQHGCLTDEDVGQFLKTESPRTNNHKFIRMVQERGVPAFNSFRTALSHFTRNEPMGWEHKQLLDSLEFGITRLNFPASPPHLGHFVPMSPQPPPYLDRPFLLPLHNLTVPQPAQHQSPKIPIRHHYPDVPAHLQFHSITTQAERPTPRKHLTGTERVVQGGPYKIRRPKGTTRGESMPNSLRPVVIDGSNVAMR